MSWSAYLKHTSFAADQLDHLAHSHSAGKAMRVHDQIRADASFAEWHVLLVEDQATNALLTVSMEGWMSADRGMRAARLPGRELITNFWSTNLSQHHLDDEMLIFIGSDDHFIHGRWHRTLVGDLGMLEVAFAFDANDLSSVAGRVLVDQDCTRINHTAYSCNAIGIQMSLLRVARI